jgi:predicted DNA-binding mobile mystery protein A
MDALKIIEQEQNALTVDSVATLMRSTTPKLGWIKTIRIALSMSGASLARRMGLQRSSVANLEKAEYDGGITLRKLQEVAGAMDCELIYYLVPKPTVDNPKPLINDIIRKQAQIKASGIVKRASTQMMLENQELTKTALKQEVARLTKQLVGDMPKDFWEFD